MSASAQGARRERNCTQMEIVQCLVPDTKEGQSSHEFRRINEASRQKTSDSSLYYFHRSAFPRVVCDDPRDIVADKYEIVDALKRIGQSSFINPRMQQKVRATSKMTSNQVHHNAKTPLPAAPPIADVPTTLTEQDHRNIAEAKSVPYDCVTKEVLGTINSLYRADYATRKHNSVGGVLLPRSQDADEPRAAAPASGAAAQEGLSKKVFMQAQQHSSELSGVNAAMEVHERRIAADQKRNRKIQKQQERLNTTMRRMLVPQVGLTPTPSTTPGDRRTPSVTAADDMDRPLPNLGFDGLGPKKPRAASARARPSTAAADGYVSLPRSYFMNRATYRK